MRRLGGIGFAATVPTKRAAGQEDHGPAEKNGGESLALAIWHNAIANLPLSWPEVRGQARVEVSACNNLQAWHTKEGEKKSWVFSQQLWWVW